MSYNSEVIVLVLNIKSAERVITCPIDRWIELHSVLLPLLIIIIIIIIIIIVNNNKSTSFLIEVVKKRVKTTV